VVLAPFVAAAAVLDEIPGIGRVAAAIVVASMRQPLGDEQGADDDQDRFMLCVYLDQNKWVNLARAATGHPKGERFRDALDVCRAAAASGTVSFPLDMDRYWETAKRGDDVSRNQLVDVMLELSRHHTLAHPVSHSGRRSVAVTVLANSRAVRQELVKSQDCTNAGSFFVGARRPHRTAHRGDT